MKYLAILTMASLVGCATTINNTSAVPEMNVINVRKECAPSNLFIASNVNVPSLVFYYERCLNRKNLLIVIMPAQYNKSIEENNIRFFISNYVKSISKDIKWDSNLIKKEYFIESGATDAVFFYELFRASPTNY